MRSVAIHIGLNGVDAAHYGGWAGTLASCENDARDMAAITKANRFEATVLLTRQATSSRFLRLLADQAALMTAGDRLVITFAGHGAQLYDINGDEPDRLDETWVFHDRMLVDDELHSALTRFRAGVRVLVLADSCHSGTSIRAIARPGIRALPEPIAATAYRMHNTTYANALSAARPARQLDQRCSVILLAACKDSQVALDGENNGLFTGTLKRVWAGGKFAGNHRALIRQIQTQMPSHQTPCLVSQGPDAEQFELERPFTSSWGTPTAAPSFQNGGLPCYHF